MAKQVRVGDRLLAVNSIPLSRLAMKDCATIIKQSSRLRMTFLRPILPDDFQMANSEHRFENEDWNSDTFTMENETDQKLERAKSNETVKTSQEEIATTTTRKTPLFKQSSTQSSRGRRSIASRRLTAQSSILDEVDEERAMETSTSKGRSQRSGSRISSRSRQSSTYSSDLPELSLVKEWSRNRRSSSLYQHTVLYPAEFAR